MFQTININAENQQSISKIKDQTKSDDVILDQPVQVRDKTKVLLEKMGEFYVICYILCL